MNPLVFGLTYLVSWLLIGLGVFLAFRFAAELRADTHRRYETGGAATSGAGVWGVLLKMISIIGGLLVIYLGLSMLLNLIDSI